MSGGLRNITPLSGNTGGVLPRVRTLRTTRRQPGEQGEPNMRQLLLGLMLTLAACSQTEDAFDAENASDLAAAATSNQTTDFASAQPFEINEDGLRERAEGIAKDAVRARLRDPDSARFDNVKTFAKAGKVVVCGRVNSRNGYGGMSGQQRFISGGDLAFLEDEMAAGEMDQVWSAACTS